MARPAGLIVGPARYILGAASFYSADDVTINIAETTVPHTVRGMTLDHYLTDSVINLSVKPDGQLSTGLIAALWPYRTTSPGTGLGTTSAALAVHDSNSHLHTVHNAFVTSMPSLHFGLEDTIIGPVGITGVRKSAAVGWEADSLYTPAVSGGTFADATYTAPVRQEYTAIWTGKTGFTTAFHSKGGFRVRVNTSVNLHSGPVLGTFMGTFIDTSIMVECEPAEQTAVEMLAGLSSQGSFTRGSSATTLGADLVITGEANNKYVFTLPDAILVGGAFNFGTSSGFLRNGVFGFVGARTLASGVPANLFTLTLT